MQRRFQRRSVPQVHRRLLPWRQYGQSFVIETNRRFLQSGGRTIAGHFDELGHRFGGGDLGPRWSSWQNSRKLPLSSHLHRNLFAA